MIAASVGKSVAEDLVSLIVAVGLPEHMAHDSAQHVVVRIAEQHVVARVTTDVVRGIDGLDVMAGPPPEPRLRHRRGDDQSTECSLGV